MINDPPISQNTIYHPVLPALDTYTATYKKPIHQGTPRSYTKTKTDI